MFVNPWTPSQWFWFNIQMRGQTVSPVGMGTFRFTQIVATKGPMTALLLPRFASAASLKSAASAALPLPLAGLFPVSALPFERLTRRDLLAVGRLVGLAGNNIRCKIQRPGDADRARVGHS